MPKKRRKAIPYRLIDPIEGALESEPYYLMKRMIALHHSTLAAARIALAWRVGWKPDKDGRLRLGQCKKASDLDRELRDFDAVILLNRETWETFTTAQKSALLDHELCHLVRVEEDGEPKRDERDRIVYRLRGHDLEEFRDVVSRHGFYKADLEEFAAVCAARSETPLFDRPAETNGHAKPAPSAAQQTTPDTRFLVDIAPAPPKVHSALVKEGLYTVADLRAWADGLALALPDALATIKGIGPFVAKKIAAAVEAPAAAQETVRK